MTQKRTSILNKGQLPGNARGVFGRMALDFGAPKKHVAQAGAAVVTLTQAQATSGDPAQFVPILDSAGLVQTTLMRLFYEAYSPFLQYGQDGQKEYLPSAKLLSSGKEPWDGHSAIVASAPYEFAQPRVWAPNGAAASLRVGLDPVHKVITQAWAEMAADGTGSLGAALRAAANFPPLGVAAPTGPGQFVLVQDVGIWLYGTTEAAQVR